LYPRSSGVGPDIGAYEVNQGDIIFVTGDDGCNPWRWQGTLVEGVPPRVDFARYRYRDDAI